jgi:hypothetical protein
MSAIRLASACELGTTAPTCRGLLISSQRNAAHALPKSGLEREAKLGRAVREIAREVFTGDWWGEILSGCRRFVNGIAALEELDQRRQKSFYLF